MRSVKSAFCGLAVGFVLSPAIAEPTSEARSGFGLIGTWSVDCCRDIMQPCSGVSCAVRHIFEIQPLGLPTKSTLTGPIESGKQPTKASVPIEAALRIASDKIKIRIVMIRNGVFYLPKKRGDDDLRSWEPTGRQVPILERCPNPAP
jgi:hypothetical protein